MAEIKNEKKPKLPLTCHARLGSMESNVFTLIGNWMKGRRVCRSEKGANNLAVLLCQKHTVGFENVFAALPSLPRKEPEFVDTLPLYSADKIPKREGKDYEWQDGLTISGTTGWLSGFLKEKSKSNNFYPGSLRKYQGKRNIPFFTLVCRGHDHLIDLTQIAKTAPKNLANIYLTHTTKWEKMVCQDKKWETGLFFHGGKVIIKNKETIGVIYDGHANSGR